MYVNLIQKQKVSIFIYKEFELHFMRSGEDQMRKKGSSETMSFPTAKQRTGFKEENYSTDERREWQEENRF